MHLTMDHWSADWLVERVGCLHVNQVDAFATVTVSGNSADQLATPPLPGECHPVAKLGGTRLRSSNIMYSCRHNLLMKISILFFPLSVMTIRAMLHICAFFNGPLVRLPTTAGQWSKRAATRSCQRGWKPSSLVCHSWPREANHNWSKTYYNSIIQLNWPDSMRALRPSWLDRLDSMQQRQREKRARRLSTVIAWIEK